MYLLVALNDQITLGLEHILFVPVLAGHYLQWKYIGLYKLLLLHGQGYRLSHFGGLKNLRFGQLLLRIIGVIICGQSVLSRVLVGMGLLVEKLILREVG